MSAILRITVIGSPAAQGSKAFRGLAKRTGRAILTEQSKAVKPWREAVIWATREALQSTPRITGPVACEMYFTMAKPKSAPKRKVTFPDRSPDIDKLFRSTSDALVMAGAIEDDARIVEARQRKLYPNEGANSLDVPGAVIVLRRLDA